MSGEPRFGTDGVRGKANEELTAQLALKLGVSAAHVLIRHGGNRQVVVGRDTRVSGDMLEAALNAGMAATGCRVTNVGVVPTPALSHFVVRLKASAGAVISASHNPYDDNGIKFLGSDGCKLPDALEDEIIAAMGRWETLHRPIGAEIGCISDAPSLVHGYIAHVAATAGGPLDGIKLVLDCANGATSPFAPDLFSNLGADVVVMNASPDGVNINDHCGSTKPSGMCDMVRKVGADAGLAFDGDGDRCMMCDETGAMVDGDRMLAVCAAGLKQRGQLAGDTVVATIMSNAGLDAVLEQIGVRLVRTDVGDRYVAEAMAALGAVLGGEQSGHLLFPRLTRTGDGMLSGLQVLAEMRISGRPLSALASAMPTYPQLLKNVRVRDKEAWRHVPEITRLIADAGARLGRAEWLSVRASGTEPLIRVMAQGPDADVVRNTVEELIGLITKHCAEPTDA